ncbi:SPOR domain-containing protein [Kiloniella antarctica]|uniref:SPOR domain-containing protein n=1 Tax=Kiloniella antarctica TaxID=1550907 RepID=A0ABW5BNH9_9PROT
MSSKPTDDLRDFEKVRQNESMRMVADRNADKASNTFDDLPNDELSGEEYWEDEIDLDDDPGAGIFKKLMPVGLGLIAVSIVGGGILIMLGDNSPKQNIPDAIPLIEAETTPEKTKPESPGGMKIPHQDKLVLNEEGKGNKTIKVEKLLPPPEVPQPPKADAVAPVTDTNTVITEVPEKAAQDNGEGVAETLAGSTEVSETKQPAQVAAVTEAPAPEVESVLAPKKPEQVPEVPKVTKTEPKASETKEVVAVAPASTPAPSKTLEAAKPVSGQYVLQLASLKSKDGAMTEWGGMQKKLSSLLGDKNPIIEKANITGVGVRYRLQTGPFADKKTANDFCAKLKSAKRDCLVKKVK